LFIVKYYVLGAVAAFIGGFITSTWYFTAIFVWLGLSLSMVSLAYLTDKPQIFRKKQNGAIPVYIRWLFIPFLVGAQLYNAWARKNDSVPPIQEILPDLYLACRLFPSDVDSLKQENIAAILDATAEFSGLNWSAEDNNLHYLNVPILDHKTPHKNDLLIAVNWIRNNIENGRGVVVHCALGRGRSVLIVAAYLLASKHAKDIDEALQMINQVRGTAKLNSYQYKKLKKIHEDGELNNRKSLLLIANPISGGGKWDAAKQEVEQLLSINYKLDIHLTSTSIGAAELVDKYKREDHFAVVACGGDGTVNEVAKRLVDTNIPLGIIPLGTTNALAHVLFGNGTKLTPITTACDVINNGGVCQIDTATCNDDIMLLVAGLGFEQRMITDANREVKDEKGQFAYVQALASAMIDNESTIYSVEIDGGEPVPTSASSLVIANSSPFSTILAQGNGEPNPYDGLLDMTIVDSKESLVVPIASLGLKSVTKTWLENEQVQGIEYKTVKQVVVSSETPLDYVVDGETRRSKHIDIRVKPESLNVICINSAC